MLSFCLHNTYFNTDYIVCTIKDANPNIRHLQILKQVFQKLLNTMQWTLSTFAQSFAQVHCLASVLLATSGMVIL